MRWTGSRSQRCRTDVVEEIRTLLEGLITDVSAEWDVTQIQVPGGVRAPPGSIPRDIPELGFDYVDSNIVGR